MPPLHPPLSDIKFSLNAWGVAGIFGGEEAISAVALIPLFQGRRWLGWYNSPGSLEVARHFGRLAQSQFWEELFPHTTKSPATLFAFDGRVGPRYTAALSGTEMQTGHLGYLAMERCKEIHQETEILGRRTIPAHVALIELGNVDYCHDVPRLSKFSALLSLIPIIVSIVTCVMCALVHDWYSFSVILVGMLASGFASATIGSGKLILKSVSNPAPGSPPGDGILVPVIWEDIVVVIKGAEPAVNAITKGKFGLKLGGRVLQYAIVVSALLLILETLAQLFLIPQGILFGQLMFVISLCVSWVYNFYISSSRRERLQADVLFKKLGDPRIHKFLLGTRTTMAVFVALLVFHGVSNPSPIAVQKMLCTFLANDTLVWEKWRKKVAQQVCDKSLHCLELDEEGDDKGLTESEKNLLGTLLRDARAAYDGYLQTPLDARPTAYSDLLIPLCTATSRPWLSSVWWSTNFDGCGRKLGDQMTRYVAHIFSPPWYARTAKPSKKEFTRNSLCTHPVFHGVSNSCHFTVQKMLHTFIPNDTLVWEKWRKKVAQQVCDKSLSCLELDEEGDGNDLAESEKKLIVPLLRDASAAYDG
ncbi:hypothetical protein OG21DRAFT_1606481 [Imleria badia]|nr:hypothetical protein OG21DRAFT_1606481 [Imleria badia]